MKKILTLGLACLTSIFAYGQVTVTYQVDATDFLAAGATLANNGMRIGGDFAANGGVSAIDTMVDWSPTDTASGMAALGNDLFSISVTYPASSIGATQYFKYVNGAWGDNEGTAATTTIATDACGVDDGAGNINRTLVIPSSDTTLRYCWDACYQCDGSDPGISDITITLQVDVTDYIAAGNSIAANGLRVGGDFAAQGASNANGAMVDWSPTDTASGMADLGSDVWSLTIIFPPTAVGSTQYFKYVNGNWGTNEGTAATSTIATGGCGVDDGAGNINRTLVIAGDTALKFCWDACLQCDGSSPNVVGLDESAFISLSMYPNPANGPVSIDFASRKDGKATVRIVNLLGQTVNSFSKEINAGENHIVWNLDAANGSLVNNGAFLVEITVNGERTMQRIAVNH